MRKVINLSNIREDKELPENVTRVESNKTVRIPILDRIYEINGEVYFETKNDSTPRKLSEHSYNNINREED